MANLPLAGSSSQALHQARLGYFKLEIQHLRFEDEGSRVGNRALDLKNVARLVRVFQLEGCLRTKEKNTVSALISIENYQSYIGDVDQRPQTPEKAIRLAIPDGGVLTCLTGRHRIATAQQFLPANDQWWIVCLYNDILDGVSQAELRESYDNNRPYTDGEIFRNIRFHQKAGNTVAEGKWMARLTMSKLKDLRQLQRQEALIPLLRAFDTLLDFPGLWPRLQLGTFHRLLTMHCPEELAHYLYHIENDWTLIIEDLANYHIDFQTVEYLQGLSPHWSTEDRSTIERYFLQNIVFSGVTNPNDRQRLQARVLSIPNIIPSLHTFLEDTKYLEPCSKILKSLLPVSTKKISLRKGFSQHYFPPPSRETRVYTSEQDVVTYCSQADHGFMSGYRQLFLFSMRHFPSLSDLGPRKDVFVTPTSKLPPDICRYELVTLAAGLGFKTPMIENYLKQNPLQKLAGRFLHDARPSQTYDIDGAKFTDGVDQILVTLESFKQRASNSYDPQLSIDSGRRIPLKERCGRPFESGFYNDHPHLFLRQIYREWQPIPRQQISSFSVKRDVFRAFFGTETDLPPSFEGYSENNQPPPSTEEGFVPPPSIRDLAHDSGHRSTDAMNGPTQDENERNSIDTQFPISHPNPPTSHQEIVPAPQQLSSFNYHSPESYYSSVINWSTFPAIEREQQIMDPILEDSFSGNQVEAPNSSFVLNEELTIIQSRHPQNHAIAIRDAVQFQKEWGKQQDRTIVYNWSLQCRTPIGSEIKLREFVINTIEEYSFFVAQIDGSKAKLTTIDPGKLIDSANDKIFIHVVKRGSKQEHRINYEFSQQWFHVHRNVL
ncbi:MAG: hypothetical protein M1834_004234 [Cirrosporium novae-zelandiae]|nr:MAG: hypothetical protein M1834_004234 [Cirrosporium novae-zelandiae]